MIGTAKSRSVAAASAAALLALTASACSKSPTGNTSTTSSNTAAAITLAGTVTFNQDNLAKLDAALKSALAGKDCPASTSRWS